MLILYTVDYIELVIVCSNLYKKLISITVLCILLHQRLVFCLFFFSNGFAYFFFLSSRIHHFLSNRDTHKGTETGLRSTNSLTSRAAAAAAAAHLCIEAAVDYKSQFPPRQLQQQLQQQLIPQ